MDTHIPYSTLFRSCYRSFDPDSAARLAGEVPKQRFGELLGGESGLCLRAADAGFGDGAALPEDGAFGAALDPDLHQGAVDFARSATQQAVEAEADAHAYTAAPATRMATDADADRGAQLQRLPSAAIDMDGRDRLGLADSAHHRPAQPSKHHSARHH